MITKYLQAEVKKIIPQEFQFIHSFPTRKEVNKIMCYDSRFIHSLSTGKRVNKSKTMYIR